MQIGGGITDKNASEWLGYGASKVYSKCMLDICVILTFNYFQVIVTSYLFPSAKFSEERLQALSLAVPKDKLVIDIR